MTEKNIFAYKLFLSLNISDFNYFLCENCNPSPPPEKVTPSKSKIWLEAQSLLQKGGWGAHYVVVVLKDILLCLLGFRFIYIVYIS